MADSNFIDYVKIYCSSGHGGAGSMHLHRAKYIPKGGPDGGDGGRGGHIILRANPQFWTLIHLKYRKNIKADDGEKGGAARTSIWTFLSGLSLRTGSRARCSSI